MGGCSNQECFQVDYDNFVKKYGDDRDRVHKFCQDEGFDRAYEWSIGNFLVGTNEICCEKDGLLF